MEPTTAELAAKVGIRTLCDWAGVARDGGLRASLLEALGEPVSSGTWGWSQRSSTKQWTQVSWLPLRRPPRRPTVRQPWRLHSNVLEPGCSAAAHALPWDCPAISYPSFRRRVRSPPPAAVAPAAGAGHKKVKFSSLVDDAADAERMFSEHGTCLGKSPYQEPFGSGLRG